MCLHISPFTLLRYLSLLPLSLSLHLATITAPRALSLFKSLSLSLYHSLPVVLFPRTLLSCNKAWALNLRADTFDVLAGCDDHNELDVLSPSSATAYSRTWNGEWHHFAVTYKADTREITVYMDGTAIGHRTRGGTSDYATEAG